MRREWLESGEAAVKTVGGRIYTEQRRLEAIEAEARRKAQEEADRKAREDAKRESEAAAKQNAPAPIVEELKRQAETATAPPVTTYAGSAPVLRGNTAVGTWKCRLKGTPAEVEPNPKMAELTPAQRAQVRIAMQAVLDGKAPLTTFEINWPALNKRAVSDKSTLDIAGFESFEAGSVRAKGRRV
jgi:hypothetical protein